MANPTVPFRLQWFLSLAATRGGRRILEAGCGNGQGLALLAARDDGATIVGIDRSPTQVRRAQQRVASLDARSLPEVHALTLAEAAERWRAEPFDLILAMNVNVFWTAPADAGSAMRALLTPRGRAVLGFEPPSAAGTARLREKVRASVVDAGFRVVGEHAAESGGSGAFAIVLAHPSRSMR